MNIKALHKLTGILIACMCVVYVHAQEHLSPIHYNNVLQEQQSNTPHISKTKSTSLVRSAKLLSLPFKDDFSYNGPYPDTNLWVAQNEVYINNTFAIAPPTWGVATFDGLNGTGVPYDTTSPGVAYGSGDSLTSLPIDLSALQPSDSVYLSFFFQPAGYAEWPNSNDTFILEFKKNDSVWVKIWQQVGPLYPGLDPVPPFQQVLIALKNDSFFFSGFQFRFREWCAITGNNDDYHIDYVKLDQHRNINDTVLDDLAYQYQPSNILANYTNMPWRQFYKYQSKELSKYVSVYLNNTYNTSANTNYSVHVDTMTRSANNVLFSTKAPSYNIPALSAYVDSFPIAAFPNIKVVDSGPVIVKTISQINRPTNGGGDKYIRNDTCSRTTIFGDYLSYDDASAEEVYAIYGQSAKLAYGFHLNQPDTLQTIAINFQQHNAYVAQDFFSILVWSSIKPEKIVGRLDYQTPHYEGWHHSFYYYQLDSPIILDTGKFYIGWQQDASDELNIGFDANDDASSHLFYNLGDSFQVSQFAGAILMRPYFGSKAVTGINQPKANSLALAVYPNPATNQLYLNMLTPQMSTGYMDVADVYGRTVKHIKAGVAIDISDLAQGLYILRSFDDRHNVCGTAKFVKQ